MNLLTQSQEVSLYHPDQIEMMETSTTETETTTRMETSTTFSPVDYDVVIDEKAKMRLRPLLTSCLNLGKGLLRLANRNYFSKFIKNINCTAM